MCVVIFSFAVVMRSS